MSIPEDEIVVTNLAGPRVTVKIFASNPAFAAVIRLGFALHGEQYTLEVASEEDRIAIIKALMSMNALFVGGAGWSPSEMVSYYQDMHLVHGDFQEITWQNSNKFVIRRHVQP